MKSKWKIRKLGDLCNISSSKRIFAREYCSKGIPFYRGKEIIEKHKGNAVSTELFISEERYAEIKEKTDVPKIGDILLSSVGTLGVPWLVDEEKFYFKDGNLTWLRVGEELDNKFLYLWLCSPEAKQQIDAKCIGSTQKAITIETLSKFDICLPSIDTQREISNLLFAIINKIVLNKRVNDNLQQQAFAIFDRLLSNKHSSECCLSQIAIINPKRILKKNELARCIDMAQLSTSGTFPNGWDIKPYNGGMRFSNGDTLLARITPCLENGKTAYIDFLNEDEVAFGSTEYIV
ncbi:MAG: restriction endonuclease subunit S, partial [Lachnospiraceae bacterium]|nr:restriction endonuclease subunit S [Lachnospiraceae bacterium]